MPAFTSVLLVDDDSKTNFLNKLLLTRMGAAQQVFVAENGEQALRTLSQACNDEPKVTRPRGITASMVLFRDEPLLFRSRLVCLEPGAASRQ